MIDTDVETGAFFPPEMRFIQNRGGIKFIYPINTSDEYRAMFGDKLIIDVAEDEYVPEIAEMLGVLHRPTGRIHWATIKPNPVMAHTYCGIKPDSAFVQQVKIKLGIAKESDYI